MMMTKYNISRRAKKLLCLTGILLIVNICFAQKIPDRPNPPRLVNDFADILTDKQEHALENKLVAYNDSSSTQICVVTVTSLDGTTSDDFAYRIGESWGVGTKNNNGVVILVKPKTADELGDVSIQVGYGMEPYITDAEAFRIRTKDMIPAFREGNYYKGIDNAVNRIIDLSSGAYKSDKNDDTDDFIGIIVVIFALAIVILVIGASGRNNNNKGGSSGGKMEFWKGLFLGFLMSGGGRSHGSGRGVGSWGGSSGGFGGFGGGHFGGGGGSSKW